MIFNSLEFLQLFVVVLIAYFGLPLLPLKRSWEWRKLLLLFASYYFYMAWNPPLVGLLIASTVMDYIAGLRMAASDNPRHRRLWLLVSMSGNLGMLGFFKYGNFIMGNIGAVTGQQYSTLDIILPVGISFYTFQTMSYVLDIYRERKQPVRSFLDFALFVTFFPQLVAGPIIRAFDFLPQLPTARRVTPWHIQCGLS